MSVRFAWLRARSPLLLSPQSSVLLLCMAARTVAALIMSGAFFSNKVLYKSIIRGII
jgi:hypothetical protein